METKKKLNRTVHGEGKSSNVHKLTIYLINPPRDSTCPRGSNTFKTTYNYKDIMSLDNALNFINESFASYSSEGTTSYTKIKKAFYNGHLLIDNGKLLNKYKK